MHEYASLPRSTPLTVCTWRGRGRYITHPDFHPDNLEFFIIADVAQGLVRWLLHIHPFVLAARPIDEERRKVLALRVRVTQKQGAWAARRECHNRAVAGRLG